QLTDRITLKNWTDPQHRIEKLSFADGTVLSIADGAALAALRVPFGAALSGSSVAENAAIGTVVGTVSGYDLDTDARLHYAFNGGTGGFDTVDMSHLAGAVLINLNVAGTQVWTTDAATLQQGTWRPLVDLSGGVENAVGANANTTFDGDVRDNRFTYAGGH